MNNRLLWKFFMLFVTVLGISNCGNPKLEEPGTLITGPPVLSPSMLEESKTSIDFARHVKPVLEARCVICHSEEAMPGKYFLTSRKEAFKPGKKGPRIIPGKPDHSILYTSMKSGHGGMTMPTVGIKIPDVEVALIRRWIATGAHWPTGKAGELKPEP